MRIRIILVLALVLVTGLVPAPTARAQMCEGTLYNNLIPGDTAIVVADAPLNARSQPSVQGEVVTQLEEDTELFVLAGPVCADGHAWYEVQLDDEQTGWVAEADDTEYWLGKLPRDYVSYERPADPNGVSPRVRLTYPEPSIAEIQEDSAHAHGYTYPGTQIILRRLDGEPIFITAIRAEDFQSGPGGYDRLEVLQILVEEWSDVALDFTYAYPDNEGNLPYVVTLKNTREFQNGRGFSYIANYANLEEFDLVEPDDFWYAFHGLTDDGAYFVTVTTPIMTPALPEGPVPDPDDMTPFFAGYQDWIDEIRAFLNEQNGASFSPLLGMVNSIVHSIEIG